MLIVLPLVLFAPLVRTSRTLRWQVFAYFTAIGLAFLFVEIAFLQKLVLLMHHPTVAFALVLATFLLGAGAGSAWSSRVAPARESARARRRGGRHRAARRGSERGVRRVDRRTRGLADRR